MKKLLILGSFKATWQVLDYAKSIGVYTIVTDIYDPSESYAKNWADEYWMISTSDVDELEKKCREENVDGVFCGLTEYNIGIMLELTERLGLPCYLTKEQWHFSKDKADFKKVCKEVGMPVAEDFYVSAEPTEEEIDQINFPVVVKPVDRAGNYGMSYVNTREQFLDAYKLAKDCTFDKDKIVIERMLHGEEWYATYAMAEGENRLLALNAMYSQPGEPCNCYSVTTTVSTNVKEFCEQVSPKLKEAFRRIGITEGIAWAQVMLDEDGTFYAIEMGQRIDGDMMFVPYRGQIGFDMIKWLVDIALGHKNRIEDLPPDQTEPFETCGCGFMLWTNKAGTISKVEGLDELSGEPGVLVEYKAKKGMEVDIYRSVGNVCFVSPDSKAMCRMIDKINKTVKILDENGDDMIIKYTDFDYLNGIYAESMK